MIIEYATKEIRDCVLRDLYLEVSAGCFEGKSESYTKFRDSSLNIDFEDDITLRVFQNGELNLVVKMDAEGTINKLNHLYTICNILDFLKAGAKK